MIVTSVFSPVINKNHPISDKTYKRNRVISLSLSLINFAIIIFALYITNNEIVICSALSFIWVTILIFIEKLKQRRTQNGIN